MDLFCFVNHIAFAWNNPRVASLFAIIVILRKNLCNKLKK